MDKVAFIKSVLLKEREKLLPPFSDKAVREIVENLNYDDFIYDNRKSFVREVVVPFQTAVIEGEIGYGDKGDFISMEFLLSRVVKWDKISIYKTNSYMLKLAEKFSTPVETYYCYCLEKESIKLKRGKSRVEVLSAEREEVYWYNGAYLSIYLERPDYLLIRNLMEKLNTPYCAVYTPLPSLKRKAVKVYDFRIDKKRATEWLEKVRRLLKK